MSSFLAEVYLNIYIFSVYSKKDAGIYLLPHISRCIIKIHNLWNTM
jgi:hypothetical protein